MEVFLRAEIRMIDVGTYEFILSVYCGNQRQVIAGKAKQFTVINKSDHNRTQSRIGVPLGLPQLLDMPELVGEFFHTFHPSMRVNPPVVLIVRLPRGVLDVAAL